MTTRKKISGALARVTNEAPAMSHRWDIETSRRALDEVNAGCLDLEMRAYVLGTKLNEMRAAGAAEALGYATWDDLVDAEIKIGRSSAYRFMSVAATFDEQEFRQLGGVSKAGVLVRLPPEQRRALLPEARNLSKRELAAKVAELASPASSSTEARPTKPHAPPPLALAIEDGDEVERDEVTAEVTSIGREIKIAKLGELAGVGVVKGLHGVCLQLAVGRDERGELVGRLLVLGGAR